MLRGAGRIRRQHFKQAFLSIEKDQKHRRQVPTFLSHYTCIHLSCISRMPQALAVHSPRVLEGNQTTHTCCAHVSLTAPRPCISRMCISRRLSADCGRYPSGVMIVVDAFTCGTNEQRERILYDIQECPATRRYFVHRETSRQLAQAMALTTLPCRAHSVMTIAHKLGCRFKSSHFESVAYQLSLREHWSSITSSCLTSKASLWPSDSTSSELENEGVHRMPPFRPTRLCHDGVQVETTSKPIRRTFHLLVSCASAQPRPRCSEKSHTDDGEYWVSRRCLHTCTHCHRLSIPWPRHSSSCPGTRCSTHYRLPDGYSCPQQHRTAFPRRRRRITRSPVYQILQSNRGRYLINSWKQYHRGRRRPSLVHDTTRSLPTKSV
ncbi:hypothetical protein EDC04DRAFT_177881 [Pisolithus marmoratus]|nr:hypothetical protein EDC04DRAFT_177881 [Pisolithus marmoratus]